MACWYARGRGHPWRYGRVDLLELVVREGAERILAEALRLEVTDFLQRMTFERSEEFPGYREWAPAGAHHRNAHACRRGPGTPGEQRPHVSHDRDHSEIVVRYERRPSTQ